MSLRRAIALSALATLMAASAARAQSVAEFYRGKTLTVLIGVSAGGEYDLQARLVARFLGKHIPGNPTMVPQNMTGAGGMTQANYLYNVAPKDGTFMGTIINALPTMQVVGVAGPQFDSAKFNWIGAIGPTVETMAIWHTADVKTIEDARRKEVIIGAVGRGGITYTFPLMFNTFAGTKFKIITGYPGGNDVNLAMERGEVAGRDNTWSSWKVTKRQWLNDKLITIIGYEGPEQADLKGVPSLSQLAGNDEDRQVIRLVTAGTRFGRPLTMAPGVPADRVAAVRAAFVAMTKDPEFLAEAKQGDIDVDPISGETLQKVAEEIAAAPKAVKNRARPLVE